MTSITGPRLTVLISNLHRLLKRRFNGQPLWVLVREAFGVGSESAAIICRDAGYEPHQKCGVKYLGKWPEGL